MQTSNSQRVWRVAEAKARLSEILRLAQDQGPQRIGTKKTYVIVPEDVWEANQIPRKSLGKWLVENVPRDTNLEIPRDRGSKRPIPFVEEAED